MKLGEIHIKKEDLSMLVSHSLKIQYFSHRLQIPCLWLRLKKKALRLKFGGIFLYFNSQIMQFPKYVYYG